MDSSTASRPEKVLPNALGTERTVSPAEGYITTLKDQLRDLPPKLAANQQRNIELAKLGLHSRKARRFLRAEVRKQGKKLMKRDGGIEI
jgi:hypothetical protein